MSRILSVVVLLSVVGCGNPGGISDAEYAAFKQLGAPKILYSCTKIPSELYAMKDCYDLSLSTQKGAHEKCVADFQKKNTTVDVGYTAGVGVAATYNKILRDAQNGCKGTFKVLESKS